MPTRPRLRTDLPHEHIPAWSPGDAHPHCYHCHAPLADITPPTDEEIQAAQRALRQPAPAVSSSYVALHRLLLRFPTVFLLVVIVVLLLLLLVHPF